MIIFGRVVVMSNGVRHPSISVLNTSLRCPRSQLERAPVLFSYPMSSCFFTTRVRTGAPEQTSTSSTHHLPFAHRKRHKPSISSLDATLSLVVESSAAADAPVVAVPFLHLGDDRRDAQLRWNSGAWSPLTTSCWRIWA